MFPFAARFSAAGLVALSTLGVSTLPNMAMAQAENPFAPANDAPAAEVQQGNPFAPPATPTNPDPAPAIPVPEDAPAVEPLNPIDAPEPAAEMPPRGTIAPVIDPQPERVEVIPVNPAVAPATPADPSMATLAGTQAVRQTLASLLVTAPPTPIIDRIWAANAAPAPRDASLAGMTAAEQIAEGLNIQLLPTPQMSWMLAGFAEPITVPTRQALADLAVTAFVQSGAGDPALVPTLAQRFQIVSAPGPIVMPEPSIFTPPAGTTMTPDQLLAFAGYNLHHTLNGALFPYTPQHCFYIAEDLYNAGHLHDAAVVADHGLNADAPATDYDLPLLYLRGISELGLGDEAATLQTLSEIKGRRLVGVFAEQMANDQLGVRFRVAVAEGR